ncbi:MAG: gamma-glutamylcyclotransferase family protein [Pyrinomonadaceae bacterium]
MSEYLFSYGTLQKAEVQLKLFGRLLNGSADSLEGFKTSEVEITDAAFLSKGEQSIQLTIVASGGDQIDGTVFEVSSDELTHAEKYEPAEYSRVVVTLISGKRAWLYLKVD